MGTVLLRRSIQFIVADIIQKIYLPCFKSVIVILLALMGVIVNVSAQALPAEASAKAGTVSIGKLAADSAIPATPAYDSVPPLPAPKTRVWLVAGGHIAAWGASYIALNKAWYAGYPKSDFHFFNDNGEWNQMDKAGHTWTAYQVSRISAGLWKWSGLN